MSSVTMFGLRISNTDQLSPKKHERKEDKTKTMTGGSRKAWQSASCQGSANVLISKGNEWHNFII